MQYLHTMLRIKNLEESLNFFIDQMGLVEVSRQENQKGRFSLIFLAAPEDLETIDSKKGPMIELTYNWPDQDGRVESYTDGRNFGHLAYRVKNIYDTCDRLIKKGVPILRPPRDGHMAFIKSPDGISIELLQAGPALEIKEPWASMENHGNW